MTNEFFDTRLYLSIRPRLEYLIPETSRYVIRALLGDDDETLLEHVCKTCSFEVKHRISIIADDTVIRDLYTLMNDVISMLEDYIAKINEDWKTYITKIRFQVVTLVNNLNQERKRNITKLRKSELNTKMNLTLDRLRNEIEPHHNRSPYLEEKCNILKQKFCAAYGSTETKSLILLKSLFEIDLHNIQVSIAQNFIDFIQNLS